MQDIKNKKRVKKIKDSYWQGFCDSIGIIKINFKNCLLILARFLEQLFFSTCQTIKELLPQVIFSIAQVRQKIRPGRNYPRSSFKPRKKWINRNNRSIGKGNAAA